MPTMSTSYGPDSVTTQTSGAPSFGGGADNSGFAQFAYEMARRRMAEREQDRTRRMAREDQDYYASARAARPAQAEERPTEDPLMREARSSALRRSILENQAAEQQAPMRMVTGPGVTPGLTMDTNNMNAIQRALYLPQGSHLVGGESSGQEPSATGPDTMSPAYRDLISQGYTPAQVRMMLAPRGK